MANLHFRFFTHPRHLCANWSLRQQFTDLCPRLIPDLATPKTYFGDRLNASASTQAGRSLSDHWNALYSEVRHSQISSIVSRLWRRHLRANGSPRD